MDKTEEIRTVMLDELAKNGFPNPTLDQQVAFLEGLRQAWIEDADENPMKREYQRALQSEIDRINTEILTS